MFDWIGDAWDAFTSIFDSGAGDPTSSIGQSVLSDIDIDNSGSIGDTPISDFTSGTDYSSLPDETGLWDMPGYGNEFGSAPPATTQPPTSQNPAKIPPNKTDEKPWYSSLLSPSVIGAAITSGAGYLNNMNNIDMAKQARDAAAEKEKMNSILALAKLKYQLLGKGAPTGGRRAGGRSAGGGAGNGKADAINAQASANLASGYGQLGGALANIYRS